VAVGVVGKTVVRLDPASPLVVGDRVSISSVPGAGQKSIDGDHAFATFISYDAADYSRGWVLLGGGLSTVATSSQANLSARRSGLVTVKAGKTSADVSFASMGAYPIIQATPYGPAPGAYWFDQITYTSFRLLLLEAPTKDLTFAWTAEPAQEGDQISGSDETIAPIDHNTGQAVMSEMEDVDPEASEPVPSEPGPSDGGAVPQPQVPEETASSTADVLVPDPVPEPIPEAPTSDPVSDPAPEEASPSDSVTAP
jgi:hypothetical protein